MFASTATSTVIANSARDKSAIFLLSSLLRNQRMIMEKEKRGETRNVLVNEKMKFFLSHEDYERSGRYISD